MDVKLHLIKGNPKGKEVEVPTGILKVGRAEDSDLIIASTRISRHHCEIINEGGKLFLRDNGSGNGSFVNGVKVVGEQALKAGDEVAIGPLTFALVIDDVGMPEATQAEAAEPAEPAPIVKAKPPALQQKAAPAKAAPAVPGLKPKAPAGGKIGMPTRPGARTNPADFLSSLEKMAGPPKKPAAGASPKPPAGKAPPAKPGQPKADDVIEISDDDLLES
jgi:predicted component of type VI protein secretion system